mmetsp:Transcript_41820/g.68840  ORF Transcript_41820/g.68840 Transcript_41820/m.68840 type:complete len:288 (-) Transcript_41820:405-1268(-)
MRAKFVHNHAAHIFAHSKHARFLRIRTILCAFRFLVFALQHFVDQLNEIMTSVLLLLLRLRWVWLLWRTTLADNINNLLHQLLECATEPFAAALLGQCHHASIGEHLVGRKPHLFKGGRHQLLDALIALAHLAKQRQTNGFIFAIVGLLQANVAEDANGTFTHRNEDVVNALLQRLKIDIDESGILHDIMPDQIDSRLAHQRGLVMKPIHNRLLNARLVQHTAINVANIFECAQCFTARFGIRMFEIVAEIQNVLMMHCDQMAIQRQLHIDRMNAVLRKSWQRFQLR